MNKELLQKHISNFIARLSADPAKKISDIEERQERIIYYKSWTSDRIKSMTEEDVYEYMSKLWAMLIWGNKQYYINKLINDNTLEKFRLELSALVWGTEDIALRWNRFRKEIKGLGPAMISEILCHVHPHDFMIWNRRAFVGLNYLGSKNLPKYDYQVTGDVYKKLCEIYKDIAKDLSLRGFEDTTLLSVDYFVWDELQVIDNLSDLHRSKTEAIASAVDVIPAQAISPDVEAEFIHHDVRDAIRDIGNFLGFEASTERKIAEGSRVDTIWESKIGNMGRIIYVFEVQTKGSLDSLLINLQQSLNSEAVQGIVAVSDKEQLERIRRKAATIPALKDRLKYWDFEEILKVKDSLQFVNESINKLKLVPEGF